jgi:hypothetical protein
MGDLVIAVYDCSHNAYCIVNKSSAYKHFVHTDSLKFLETEIKEISYPSTDPLFINSDEKKQQVSPCTSIKPPLTNSPSSPVYASSPPPAPATPTKPIQTSLSLDSVTEEQQTCTTNSLLSVICNASATMANHQLNPQPSWFVARVSSKEFCVAKKESNRYKLPANTRFYRVRIEPFNL